MIKNKAKKCFFSIRVLKSRVLIALAKIVDRLSIVKFYQSVPELNIHKTDELTFGRWDAMKGEFSGGNGPMSVLDIGSNSGFYSIKIAKLGHCVTAIDSSIVHYSFLYNATNVLDIQNIHLGRMHITEENVGSLPDYDCILLLNVFHHWCRFYGAETALRMLDVVYHKTKRVMFFETGQTDTDPWVKDSLPDMGEAVVDWMIRLFEEKGAKEVKELYKRTSRKERSLLLIRK